MSALMRVVLLGLLALFAAFGAQEHEGDFDIRFEPTAKLQTGAPIPFSVTVRDSLGKPVSHARVKFQIEDSNGGSVQLFRTTEISPGNYVAKPEFKAKGEWTIYVEVRRELAMSARTIQFQVTD